MRVTTLDPSAAAEYRELMLHAYERAADAFTSTREERANEPESWWAKRIASADGLGVAFGAYQEDRLIGTVALEFSAKPKTRHKAHLIGMFVLESCRGLGAGKALVQAAIECATSRPSVRSMILTVTEGNEAAIHLYRACGFLEFGKEPMAILTPSGYKAKLHMWRDLKNG
ncbi:MAG: GNAT family N-acetyltransferase [Burkholderiaceae bacterium]